MRCSFEETVDVLMDAAAHAEADPMRGEYSCAVVVTETLPIISHCYIVYEHATRSLGLF